ncbi:MAG: leucine-rich repeat protein [Treponema sp.]|jgi:TPR repeat protein|nr:leucine-rich repeat protein [Treponema sp.]
MVLNRKIKVLQIGGNTQKNGITTFLLSAHRRMREDFTFVFINTAFRVADEEVAKVIYELGGKIYHLPCANSAAEIETELKEVLRTEQPDAIHTHYFYSNGDYMRIAFDCDIPIRISHCHNDKSKFITDEQKAIVARSRQLIEKYATTKLAVSKNAGKFLYGNYSFDICHASIETDKFYPIDEADSLFDKYKLDKKYKYSLFVGRFAPQKNVEFFIEIFKGLQNRKLIMVGGGEGKPAFIERIKSAGIADKFIFMGDTDLNELYNIADSFLLPSLYEGANLTLVEAQCAGTPCFASDTLGGESNLGGVTFLPLKAEAWIDALKTADRLPRVRKVNFAAFCADNTAARLFGLYSDNRNLSERYIALAKEYMLGSAERYGNRTKVAMYFKRAHEFGNPRGTFYYALQYFEGSGVDKSIRTAESLVKDIGGIVEQAAQDGKPEYIVILADMYSFGLGKPQSFTEAFNYYTKAAELGNAEAMCDLGYMYSVGQGVNKDLAKSFEWYKKSADLGYLHSIRDVGVCYYEGAGTPQDYTEAVKWFKKASAQNYSHATCDLALCYLNGNGVKRDLKRAAECYLLAIKQDRVRAIRDVIANCIDVKELLSGGKILYAKRDTLDVIDENVMVDNTIVINKHIRNIDPSAFYSHTNITKFFVEKDNENYKAYGGVLYSKDGTTLIRFPLGSLISEFAIPEHVKHIGAHAFQNCRNLAAVRLHNGIVTIGDSAFDDCKNLSGIVLPPSIEAIGGWAFHGCDKIERVHIPASVKTIGTYAFGSCEALGEITVDANNKIVAASDGNLYSKDFSVILQYAIGKYEKLFALPASVKEIAFRAFSDAFNLEYIDARSAAAIEGKAFYYCTSLKEILLIPECKIDGENAFGHTAEDFKIIHGSHGRMLLLADIHGHLRLDFLANKIDEFSPTVNDVIIILGDAGIVWQTPMRDDIRKFYMGLPCDVLFLDGNHENFDLLNSLPRSTRYGGAVHEVLPNVFHLMRGNAYLINGHKYFVFGGGYSIKRETNSSPVQVWEEELPSDTEYAAGIDTLKLNDNRFDYVLTHQAPKSVLDSIAHYYAPAEAELVNYLEGINAAATYKGWYFGHLHKDFKQGKFISLYEKSEVIE